MYSETRRQVLHIAMSAFALLLRVLSWWQAAIFAVAALLFNALVLPRAGGGTISRPAEVARGVALGILIYPLAVLLLILAFPQRLDIAASAWGILAWGDGAATLVGRRFGRHRLGWNPDKTWEGSAAFLLAAGAAGVCFAWWTAPSIAPVPPRAFIVGAPLVAALAAALVETIPIRLDDNFSVPAVAGATLWGLSLASGGAVAAGWPAVEARMGAALAINTVAAIVGWRAGTVRLSGMIAGWAIGVGVYACTGLNGWLLLFATFLVASLVTRLGVKRKAILGIAEEREGRRGGGNAFANTGVAAIAAVMAVVTPYPDAALLAFVAALTAGGSDTVASEIGKAWGSKTYFVTTLSQVRPGTPGAMSLEGTAAGLVGAFALAALGVGAGLIPDSAIWAVVAGAVIGSLIESALGATLEAPGIVNNDVLNFINTAAATIVAVVIGT